MSKILVVGGGIIGLLTARELALAGAEVTLVEMTQTGRESSWAGGGILSPLYPWRSPDPVTALARWSQTAYPALALELHDATGIDPELTASGLLILDPEEEAAAADWTAHQGQRLELLDADTLHRREPELGVRPSRALLLPDIAQVRTPRLAKAARQWLNGRVEIHEQAEVRELLIEGDRVAGVRARDETLRADQVVICAGAWTAALLAPLGAPPEIAPVRGQMMLFLGKPGQLQHITLHRERYVIPRRDGRVLIGSTLEQTGFVKATTAEAKEALYRAAIELFPVLKRTPIEDHWAGLRPGSPSGIPYLGPHPRVAGLFVNAGHFRNGLVTGPASARLIADLMLAREPILDASPYALTAPR